LRGGPQNLQGFPTMPRWDPKIPGWGVPKTPSTGAQPHPCSLKVPPTLLGSPLTPPIYPPP